MKTTLFKLRQIPFFYALLAFLALLPAYASAQTYPIAKTPVDAVWPWEGTALVPDPAVTYGRLTNGMRYVIRVNKLPQKEVVLRFRFDVGSKHERDDQRGIAHLIEHMAFNGSANIPEGEMTKTLERLGASFGSDINAHVTYDETMYKLDVPSADGGRLETALKIFRETADRLLLKDDAIKREIGVVMSELNDGDTPSRRISRRTSAFLTPNDRRIMREPIGQRAVIEGANSSLVREFYETWYRPERAILVVVGDVDVEATKALIEAHFSDWRAKAPKAPEEPDNGSWPASQIRAQVQIEPEQPSTMLIYALRPDETDYGKLDTVEKRKWWLLQEIGADVFRRRLSTMQLVDNPPTAGVSYTHSKSENGWGAAFTFLPRNGDWKLGVNALTTELRQALDKGFNAAEIAEAIKESRLGYDRQLAEASTRRTLSFANSLTNSLANRSVDISLEERKRLFEEVAASATLERVKASFAWWWSGAEPAINLTSKTAVTGGEEAVTTAWRVAMTAPLAARTPYVRAQYKPVTLGAAGKVDRSIARAQPPMQTVIFENGVRLSFMHTDYSKDRVSLRIGLNAGYLAFPFTDPVWPTFATTSWNGDGVGALTRDQMITALAGRSTSLASVRLDPDTLEIFALPAKADLPEQLQVALSQVLEPRLGPRAATVLQDQMRAGWGAARQTASGWFRFNSSTYFETGLASYDPPNLETYLSTDLELGKRQLKALLASSTIHVVIVGDTTFEAARDAVAQTFGALPKRSGIPLNLQQLRSIRSQPTGGPARVLSHSGSQQQALVHVSWVTPGSQSAHQSDVFNILGAILQLRLTDKVREAAGQSYSPDGGWMSDAFSGRGRLYAHATITPDQVAPVEAVMDKIAADLAANGPTADELQRVVGPMVEQLLRSRQSNAYWVAHFSEIDAPKLPGSTRGLALDREANSEKALRSISLLELRRAARLYLKPNNAIRIHVVPAQAEAPRS